MSAKGKGGGNGKRYRTFEYNGKQISAKEAAEIAGCSVNMINDYLRSKGWNITEVIDYC